MEHNRDIKVFEAAKDAIERTKQILFLDFDIANWFAIGFCAWLASFGNGFSFNFNGFSSNQGHSSKNFSMEEVRNHIQDIDPKYIIIAAIVFVAIISVVISQMWLSSRGKFMLMHCVAKNVAEVKRPWNEYKLRANSLFRFRLSITVVTAIFLIGIATISWKLLFANHQEFQNNAIDTQSIIYIVGISLASMLIFIPLLLVHLFTGLFIVPVMYKHNLRCTDAWKYFLTLLRFNKWNFVKFLLATAVINVIVFFTVIISILATCCLLGCIFSLPYIGTVALLPIIIFYRSYSAIYLGQYGENLNVLEQIPSAEQPQPISKEEQS